MIDVDETIRGSRKVSPGIDVQHVPTLAALETVVAEAGGVERVLFSDLSLGAWRPHQIAAEWAECLGVTPYPTDWTDTRPSARAQLSFGAIADAGIEMEALGDRVVREASALCRRLAARLAECDAPYLLAVIAPAAGRPWREENLVFLRFMLAALDGTNCRLRLLVNVGGREEFDAPQGMLLQWRGSHEVARDGRGPQPPGLGCLPGIVPRTLAPAFGGGACLSLRHGGLLPAPESRPAGPAAPAFYDRIRPLLSGHPWLDAYAQFAGSNFHADPAALARHATSAFELGGSEIAIDYLARAIGCARGIQRAGLQCQMQGYRIATHRFSEAAVAWEDSPNLPPKLAAFLSMARGWGAVMSGQAENGIMDLKRSAGHLGEETDDKFKAYLENITALGLAQVGSLDEAMNLEEAVQKKNTGPQRSWPLYYVNQINTARLHRRRGDIEKARQYYQAAFASHWGGRSVNDRVYANAVMARLAEAAGQDSALYWVRSALHFAAADMPESFGARHASLVVGKPSTPNSREQRVEDVADALASRVEAAAPRHATDGALGPLPVFTERAPDPARAPQALLIGAAGWSLIADTHPVPPIFNGASMRRLRRALGLWIASRSPVDLKRVCTFYVDSRLGREMAINSTEALEAALRLNIGSISFDGFELRPDADLRGELNRQSWLQISELVSDISRRDDSLDVRFKRCRPPVRLSDETGIVAAAQRGKRLGDVLACRPPGLPCAQVFAEVSRLEAAGVLWRSLPTEAAVSFGALSGSAQ